MAHNLTWTSPVRAAFVAEMHEQRRVYFACKRLLDIAVAAPLLLVLAPFMVLIAILVSL